VRDVTRDNFIGEAFGTFGHVTGTRGTITVTRRANAACEGVEKFGNVFSVLLWISSKAPHPNLGRILEIHTGPDGLLRLSTEPLTGMELFDHLAHVAPPTEGLCQHAMRQALDALRHLHSFCLIHRDARLDNFRFRSLAPGAALVLIDFELCCHADQTTGMEAVGNEWYMAPEMLTRKYTTQVDLWSMGVGLCIFLTGHAPSELSAFGHSATGRLYVEGSGDPVAAAKLRECTLAHQLASDLLMGLLETNPDSRLSAAAALEHRWFTNPSASIADCAAGAPTLGVHASAYLAAKCRCAASAYHSASLARVRQRPWVWSGDPTCDRRLLSLNDGGSWSGVVPSRDIAGSNDVSAVVDDVTYDLDTCAESRQLAVHPITKQGHQGEGESSRGLNGRLPVQLADVEDVKLIEGHFTGESVMTRELDRQATLGKVACPVNMLFSSPLCIRKIWRVRLKCPILHRRCDMANWGVTFETQRPWVIAGVHVAGQLAAWNDLQEHSELMVGPGDELCEVVVAGKRMLVHGRSAKSVLQAISNTIFFNGADSTIVNDASSHVAVELLFQGMRPMEQLRMDKEIAALSKTGWEVLPRVATAENIRSLIATGRCRVLYFALHCSADQDNILLMEDRHGQAHVMEASKLHQLLVSGQPWQNISLVVLNACHSLSLGMHFIAAGVPHVICVRDDCTVRDKSCQLFGVHFFSALHACRSVRDSFDCGVAVLACSHNIAQRCDAGGFVLLPEGADHTEVFAEFHDGAASCAAAGPPPEFVRWGDIPPRAEDFMGRGIDTHRLYQLADGRRFIELQGEHGVGKSALMAEVGRFAILRRDVFQEVRWVGGLDDAVQAGLEDLHRRLACKDQDLRVLLLIDSPAALAWPVVQALLCVHAVHVITSAARLSPGADAAAGPLAAAAGLKLVRFDVLPLEPIVQAKLFLHRAGRPLFTCELEGDAGADVSLGKSEIVVYPRRPADFMALAASPLIRRLGGNPVRIGRAAERLGTRAPKTVTSATSIAKLSPKLCDRQSRDIGALGIGTCAGGDMIASQWRKVRLVRSDGHSRDEWLPHAWSVADVLHHFTPRELQGTRDVDVFVDRCRAQPITPLMDFPDDVQEGMLVLEFRAQVGGDW
jgi:hypothetical protein